MIEYIVRVNENDERWHYVEQQYTHFFGYQITEEIVRCRDCRNLESQTVSYSDKPIFVCTAEWCEGAERDNPLVEPDGFCAWGERREDNDDEIY